MRKYQDKIKAYNQLIEDKYVKEEHIVKTVESVKQILPSKEDEIISYLEFIYLQSKYIKKRYFGFQTMVLFALWILLSNMGSGYYTERLLGLFSSLFACLILPEMWKNRRNISTEIESVSYYSLRQIYSARMIVFSIVDILLLTIFLLVIKMPILDFTVNFVIPFNVALAICFRFLSDSKKDMMHSFMGIAFWTALWTIILANNILYSIVVFPLWMALLLFSFIYLFYSIKKMQRNILYFEEAICN